MKINGFVSALTEVNSYFKEKQPDIVGIIDKII